MSSITIERRDRFDTIQRQIWKDAIEVYNRQKTRKHPIVLSQAEIDPAKYPFDSIERMLQIAEQCCKKVYSPEAQSQGRRTISSLLQEVRQYAPILDVCTQGAPCAVSACWAMARLVLEASTKALTFGQSLLDGICGILRKISIFNRQLEYLASNKQSLSSITQLYACLIDYLARASRYCKSRRWRRAMKAPSIKLTWIYDEVSRLAKEVESQVAVFGFTSIDDFKLVQTEQHNTLIQNDVEQARRHQLLVADAKRSMSRLAHQVVNARDHILLRQEQQSQDRQVLDWLNLDLILNKPSVRIEDGTCCWLQRHPRHTQWQTTRCSQTLWIKGPSGSGKSALSFAAATHAAESGRVVIYASVLPSGSYSQSPVANLVISLLSEIVQHKSIRKSSHFPDIITHLASNRTFGLQTAVSTPTGTLISILKCIIKLLPPVLLIIDGVDQLKDDTNQSEGLFADSIVSLFNEISAIPSIALMLFSRPREWIALKMDKSIELEIPRESTDDDIAVAIRNTVRKDRHLEHLDADIIRTTRERASGDFMYATLLLDELKKARSTSDQRSILAAAPPDTETKYRELCRRKVATLRPKDRTRRNQIFLLLLGCKTQFRAEEINDALALDLIRNVDLQDEKLFDPDNAIPDLAEPFVAIDGTFARFRHESARKYVLDELVTIRDANSFLLDICLTKLIDEKYMQLGFCARLLENNLLIRSSDRGSIYLSPDDSGLYDHATLHWHEYALELQYLSKVLWEKLKLFLHSNAFVAWSEHLFVLRNGTGLDGHLNVGVSLARWYERLPNDGKPEISIGSFVIQPYEDISAQLKDHWKDPILQYLALIRPGTYLNLGGRTKADFEMSLEFHRQVVDGLMQLLGPQDRNTLNARVAFCQGLQALRRPDEALEGYQDILKIQRKILDENSIDIYKTLQWIGNAYRLLAKFPESRTALEEALTGYKRILGADSKFALFVSLGLAFTFDAAGDLEEAATAFRDIRDKWVPINGSANLFAASILTAYGSVLRKQGHYRDAGKLLFEAFATRLRLLTLANDTTVDSGLHLCVLYRQMAQREHALSLLSVIEDSEAFNDSFERMCEREHIRALLAFDGGDYKSPRNELTKLVMMSTGENREKNNRELLWVRLNLADAARAHNDEDAIPTLFAELVVPADSASSRSSVSTESIVSSPSSEELIVLDTPKQLKVAEQALRFTRDKRLDKAKELLESEQLNWARDKDFWILGGGPKVDTDTVKYRLPRLLDAQEATYQESIENFTNRLRELMVSQQEACKEVAFTWRRL